MGLKRMIESPESDLYQVELEVQNQELKNSRQLLEDTVELYSTLYDYAAVSCIAFDFKGCIQGANITAAKLLHTERDRLIGLPFARWLHPASLPDLFSHLKQCREGKPRVVSKLKLMSPGQAEILVLLVSAANPSHVENDPESLSYQSAIIDLRELTA